MTTSRENLTDRFLTALLTASAGLAVFALALQPFLPEGDMEGALALLHPGAQGFASPEPGESLCYILLCMAAIPLAWASWQWAGKRHWHIPDAAGLLLILLWWLAGWGRRPPSLAEPGGLLLLVMVLKYFRSSLKRTGGRWPVRAALILCAVLTLSHRIPEPWNIENYSGDHMNIILYALNSAVHGLPEIHLYGFYPAFFVPVFRWIGLTFLNAELVMNLCYFAAFALVADAARRLIRSDIFLFGALISALLICGNGGYLVHGNFLYDPYFAYWPVRFLFPALALNLASRRNVRHFAVWSAVLSAGSLWFNPDTGIAVTGALFAVILFSGQWREAGKFLGVFLAAVPGWLVLLRIFCGFWQDYAGYLSYMQNFWRAGYMLIPIRGFPIWILPALVTAGALVWSFRRLPVRQESRPVLFLAVLGAGLFNYYIGRSHPGNLPSCTWPELLLLFMFADRVRKTRKITAHAVLYLACSSLALLLLWGPLIVGDLGRLVRDFGGPSTIGFKAEAIRRLAGTESTVNILPKYQQGYFYAETGLKPGISGFGMSELLFQRDQERIMEELKSSPYPLVITQEMELAPELQSHYRLTGMDPETGVRLYMPAGRSAGPLQ